MRKATIATLTFAALTTLATGCNDHEHVCDDADPTVVTEYIEVPADPVDPGYIECDSDIDCSQGEICAALQGEGEVQSVCVVAEGGLGLTTCDSDSDCADGICVDIVGVDGSVCTDGASIPPTCFFEKFDNRRYRYIAAEEVEVVLVTTYIEETCELFMEEEGKTSTTWTYLFSLGNEVGDHPIEAYGVYAEANSGTVVVNQFKLTHINISESFGSSYAGGVKIFDFILIP